MAWKYLYRSSVRTLPDITAFSHRPFRGNQPLLLSSSLAVARAEPARECRFGLGRRVLDLSINLIDFMFRFFGGILAISLQLGFGIEDFVLGIIHLQWRHQVSVRWRSRGQLRPSSSMHP